MIRLGEWGKKRMQNWVRKGTASTQFFLAHPVPTGRTSMNSLCICVFKVAKCVKPVSVGRVSFVDLDPRRITIRFWGRLSSAFLTAAAYFGQWGTRYSNDRDWENIWWAIHLSKTSIEGVYPFRREILLQRMWSCVGIRKMCESHFAHS